jgi:hypothetical protein
MRALLFSLGMMVAGCMSIYQEMIGEKENQYLEQVFVGSFPDVWQSVLDSMKAKPLEISSQESGFVQTKWIVNTLEKNQEDGIENQAAYIRAQYRFQVHLLKKELTDRRQGVLVTLRKQQMVMRDVLDGWQQQKTDGVEEQTVLYRIGRLIFLRKKMDDLNQKITQEQLE